MIKHIIGLLSVLSCLFVLSGCGLSGPLYLPAPKQPPQQPAQTQVQK